MMYSESRFQCPFEKLDVWHKAKDLCMEVYRVTSGFPDKERFGLISQINRAAISVASNIAEGSSRSSKKEQAHFTEIAFGSLMEVICQLIISKELEYLSGHELEKLRQKADEIARMLTSLRAYQKGG